MNQVILIGRLVADPELRYTQNGKPVCTFRLTVDRRFNREKQQADFFKVTAWGPMGDSIAKYLRKGSQCAVRGRVEISSYTDKDGNNRYSTDIQAEQVQFLGGKNEGGGSSSDTATEEYDDSTFPAVEDDDIPF